MTAITQALGAYANAAAKVGGGPAASTGTGGVSFGDLLKDSALDSLNQSRKAENLSGKAIQGKADLSDVVNAVTSAETTLMTVVSLRDRMVASLQEIMRMPV